MGRVNMCSLLYQVGRDDAQLARNVAGPIEAPRSTVWCLVGATRLIAATGTLDSRGTPAGLPVPPTTRAIGEAPAGALEPAGP